MPSRRIVRRRAPLALATTLCAATALALPAGALAGGTISSIDPPEVAVGSNATPIIVNGEFKVDGIRLAILIDGPTRDLLPARSQTASALGFIVPASQFRAAGDRKITVYDCPPTGLADETTCNVSGTEGFPWVVNDPGAPLPVLTGVTPQAFSVLNPPTSLTATGSDFTDASAVTWNGTPVPSKPSPPGSIEFVPAAGLLATAGTATVRVVTPLPGGGTSGPIQVTIQNPAPVITSITPVSITAGSGELVVNVTGSDFVPNSVIEVDDSPLPTTVVNAGMAWATIPAASLAAPGTLQIAVRSPAPIGGVTGPLPLTVQAPPPPPPGGGAGDPTPPAGPSVGETGPLAGEGGSLGTLVGSGLGARQGTSLITVGGVPVGRALIWRDARIEFKVPDLPPGTYPVQLIINGIATTIGEYTIGPTPPAPPIANPVLAPAGGRSVLFDASLALGEGGAGAAQSGVFRAQAVNVTGITSIIWRFGDGTTSNKTTVSKTYNSPGNYNASVTVTDAGGRSSTVRQTIRVRRNSVDLPPVNLSIPNRVVFDFGSAELREEATPVLRKLAKLVRNVGRRTLIGGHTDAIGPAAYNLSLSEERAKAVRRFLVQEAKVSPLLLTAVGFGESAPLDTNDTPLGRQRNRRVTFQIARSVNPIKLNGRTAQINQRIATAVLLRERALRRRLAAGLTSSDIQNGAFYSGSFTSGVIVSGAEKATAVSAARPKGIKVPKLPNAKRGFPFTRKQLRINERISRTAVVRVNALIKRLEKGIRGGDVRNGAITTDKLAPGLSFASVQVAGAPQQTTPFTVQSVPLPKGKKGPVTEADLLKDQRRSQAAIRRINILISRFNEGFSVDDFAPGAIEGVDVKAG
ncbi:MAG: OmpA family protein [Thermoleophilia bacterium]|nr:OmpA family protein [Thermoleophilia bacterium]